MNKFKIFHLFLAVLFLFTVVGCDVAGNSADNGVTTTLGSATTTSIVTVTSIVEAGGTTSIVTATSIVYSTTTTTIIPIVRDPVNLGTAANFVILAKSEISTVPNSAITGNIGVSPAAASYITGFSLIMDVTNTFSKSTQITGNVYASDYTDPTPTNMTTAISDMETAYTEAAGRLNPDFVELHAGDLSGKTLVPGLYKWSTGVLISTDVVLSGDSNDVWIFQISGDVTITSGVRVTLEGGALPENIFWQCFGAVSINTTAHVEGIVMCQTEITLATGATVNGRLLAQTAVTLDSNTVVQP